MYHMSQQTRGEKKITRIRGLLTEVLDVLDLPRPLCYQKASHIMEICIISPSEMALSLPKHLLLYA